MFSFRFSVMPRESIIGFIPCFTVMYIFFCNHFPVVELTHISKIHIFVETFVLLFSTLNLKRLHKSFYYEFNRINFQNKLFYTLLCYKYLVG